MTDHITINAHSSIRAEGEKTVYFDPFRIERRVNDADIIFITHPHYDHFSPEDIEKTARRDTVFVCPESIRANLSEAGIPADRIMTMNPGESAEVLGVPVEAVRAYNTDKPNHPREKDWLGYVVTLNGDRIYVCGDTDDIPEGRAVKCDIMCVPVGGTYTLNTAQAAAMVNAVRPREAIPTHYGCIVGKKEDGEIFAALVDEGIETSLRIG